MRHGRGKDDDEFIKRVEEVVNVLRSEIKTSEQGTPVVMDAKNRELECLKSRWKSRDIPKVCKSTKSAEAQAADNLRDSHRKEKSEAYPCHPIHRQQAPGGVYLLNQACREMLADIFTKESVKSDDLYKLLKTGTVPKMYLKK